MRRRFRRGFEWRGEIETPSFLSLKYKIRRTSDTDASYIRYICLRSVVATRLDFDSIKSTIN